MEGNIEDAGEDAGAGGYGEFLPILSIPVRVRPCPSVYRHASCLIEDAGGTPAIPAGPPSETIVGAGFKPAQSSTGGCLEIGRVTNPPIVRRHLCRSCFSDGVVGGGFGGRVVAGCVCTRFKFYGEVCVAVSNAVQPGQLAFQPHN